MRSSSFSLLRIVQPFFLVAGAVIAGTLCLIPHAHAAALEVYSTPLFNDANLASYYRMEGNSNDGKGSANGSDTSITYGSSYGTFGQGASLNGGSSEMDMGNVFDETGASPFSISAWVKTNAGGANVYSIASRQIMTYPYTGWQFGLNIKDSTSGNAGKLGFQIYDGSTGVALQSAGTYNDNAWHFVAATYDGSKNVSGITLYVDGVPLTGTTSYLQSSMAGSSSNAAHFQVGSRNNANQVWNGSLDDAAVFTRVLSPAEIQILYQGSFYAPIKNTGNGRWLLRSTTASSSNANLIKRFPEDWIVYVSSTVSATGTPVIADGYRWYNVVDPTDGVEGWMAASNASDTVEYLPYPATLDQSGLAASANTVYSSSTDRAAFVGGAVDVYYNNASTTKSLYSSDDGNNELSMFKTGVLGGNTYSTYPEQIILGISIAEDGTAGHGFNNENISFDYGHGVMQLTPYQVFHNEPSSSVSNTENVPATASWLEIFPCRSYDEFNNVGTSTYENCYTHAGTSDSIDVKSYQHYGGDSSQPKYMWYGNTAQSIYANVKDGMRKLQDKYYFSPITTSTTTNGTTYTGQEREIILATEAYNGTDCGYVNTVASDTDAIDQFFPGETTSSIADILHKMHTAGSDMICAQLHSPATLNIGDATGRVVGIVNGKGRNDFPLAVYDPKGKWADILAAENGSYTYKVTGAGTGTYGFDITMRQGSRRIAFSTTNMPVVPGQIDTYTMDANAILKGQKGVVLQVDIKGNGTINKSEVLDASILDDPSPPEIPQKSNTPSIPINPVEVLFNPKMKSVTSVINWSAPSVATGVVSSTTSSSNINPFIFQ